MTPSSVFEVVRLDSTVRIVSLLHACGWHDRNNRCTTLDGKRNTIILEKPLPNEHNKLPQTLVMWAQLALLLKTFTGLDQALISVCYHKLFNFAPSLLVICMYVPALNEARPKERSDRGRFLPLSKKASS